MNPEIVELNPPLGKADLEYVRKEFRETETKITFPHKINETVNC